MGNETSGFQNVVLGEEHRIDGKQGWGLHSATKKDGGKVSVFVYKKDKDFKQYVDSAVKNLKVLRHPCIVKFLALRSTSDADLLITEHVRPLLSVLDDMTPGEICVGLYNILEALSFLHEKCGSCYNNVCLSSIFVGDDGSWLLGAVEYICRFDQATNNYLSKCRNYRNQAAIPPEEKAGRVEANAEYGAARDAYGFGVMAEQLLEYLVTDASDSAEVEHSSTKTFELRVQDECLNPQPSQRPRLSSLLDDRLFKTDFVEISNFIKQITLKTEEEKKQFFTDLAEKLHSVPVSVLASRLVRSLLARFVLLDPTADKCLLPHLLTPYSGATRPAWRASAQCCPLLPVVLFRKHVLPELYKIFHVRDAHIRKVLLAYFPCYVQQFDEETLIESIMPQIVLGLRDADDELVAASLHCLGDLVSLIGADTVIGQGRARIFSAGKPKFANTDSKVETNGVLPERTPFAKSEQKSEPVEKKKTLKEIAREADKQKRKEETRQRAKERQKRREEEKSKIKLFERGEPVTTMSSEAPPHQEPVDQSKATIENNQSETPTQSDNDADNWEGWEEEPNVDNGADHPIDSDIDREIERELTTMGSPPPLSSSDSNTANTASFTSSQSQGSKVDIDWSDIPADRTDKTDKSAAATEQPRKGRLKLSSAKTRMSPPPQSHMGAIAADSTSKSPNRKHIQPEIAVKKEKPKETSHKQLPRRSGPTQLGAEFDIKALDIKATTGVSSEPDFFADMAPKIIKTSNVLDILEGKTAGTAGTTGTETGSGKKSTVLAYTPAPDADEDGTAAAEGWGDDFGDDWGNDD